MRPIFFNLSAFCCGLALCFGQTAWAAQPRQLTVQPEVLQIGTFYSGGQVTISGEVSDGQDVIVEIIGPTANGKFDIKGRVGPFWMTRAKAELDGAPSMYALLLPTGQDWQQKVISLGLGLDRLRREISIQADALTPDDIFNMFLQLKKKEGLYMENPEAVAYGPVENGHRPFSAVCLFPRSTATGDYTIKATVVANDKKSGEQSCRLQVEEVGFTRMVDNLASNRRLLYGIMAVLIALFTGALMGLIFKGGGSH